jgi:hypothetical protein
VYEGHFAGGGGDPVFVSIGDAVDPAAQFAAAVLTASAPRL